MSFPCRLSVRNDTSKGSAMVPLGKAMTTSNRLSKITMSLSAAVGQQF